MSRGFSGHTSFPWTVLGVHIAAAIAILAWSIFWSTLLFGALKYFKMLRVSTEMEFKGMDLVKHGEAAYPAGAWVEYQYNKTDKSKAKEGEATTNPCMSGGGVIAGTMTMDGAKTNIDGEVYNNPFEMVSRSDRYEFSSDSNRYILVGADHRKVDEADVRNILVRHCWYLSYPLILTTFSFSLILFQSFTDIFTCLSSGFLKFFF